MTDDKKPGHIVQLSGTILDFPRFRLTAPIKFGPLPELPPERFDEIERAPLTEEALTYEAGGDLRTAAIERFCRGVSVAQLEALAKVGLTPLGILGAMAIGTPAKAIAKAFVRRLEQYRQARRV